jgi:hypothetical protein
MKIVEIQWVDSTAEVDVWEQKDDYSRELEPIKTIGYLIEQDKDKVIICQSVSDSQYGQTFRIPKGCIKKIKTIKETK